MDQTLLGIGTRLQHQHYGQGVITGVKYATYLITFITHGTKEVDKTDSKLDEIIPENVSTEVTTTDEMEMSLLKILKMWGGLQETIHLGERYAGILRQCGQNIGRLCHQPEINADHPPNRF